MDFRLKRGASDAHTRSGLLRSEQRSLSRKDMPPAGLRCFWVLDFVAPRSQPAAGMPLSSRLARTQKQRNECIGISGDTTLDLPPLTVLFREVMIRLRKIRYPKPLCVPFNSRSRTQGDIAEQ